MKKNELVPQRTVVGYRMCIDFRKLNKATKTDNYPFPFIDQMLERLSKNTHFSIWMAILVSLKSMLENKTKRKPR